MSEADEHVVFYPARSGSAAFRRVASLAEGLATVEQLRNVEGVVDATLHRLTAVPLSIRPYYRVEVAPCEPPAPEPAAEVAADPADSAAEAVPAGEASAEAAGRAVAGPRAAANGKRGLAFFAS